MVSQGFFSGSANQKKRMAGDSPTGDIKLAENKVAQPLSEVGSPAYEKEVQSYIKIQKSDPLYNLKFDSEGYRINKFRDRVEDTPSFSEDVMRQNYEGVRKFLYERNPLQYQEGVPLSKKKEDEGNILQRTGTFLANMFSSPAVAGTLEGKPTRFAGQASPTVNKETDTRSSITSVSRSSGGFGGGVGNKTNRRGSGIRNRRCDIRTKIDINPLTNNNLIRDDLANVAYFVQEIK